MTETFVDHEAPELFECNIDRIHTGMGPDYLPNAPGILIAGKDLLRAAGYVPGAAYPRYWEPAERGKFRRLPLRKGGRKLWVSRFSEFWFVERSLDSKMGMRRTLEVLVFALLELPICTRNPEAAMWLASYADRMPKVLVPGRWAKLGQVRLTNHGFIYTPAAP